MSVNDGVSAGNKPNIARKLSLQDVKAVANLVATRCLTETESCHIIGIEPVRWFNWKQKAGRLAKFDSTLARMRAAKIEQCIARIDDCGDGIGLKQPDWRAKAWLLQVTDRKRFGNESAPVERETVVNILVMAEAAKRIYDVETVEPKLLSAKAKIKLPTRRQDS